MSKFKVGDKVRWLGGAQTAVVTAVDEMQFWCTIDGSQQRVCGKIDDWKLIEPAHQGPVRTVTTTRKEIVPGVYDRLKIGIVYGRGQRAAVGINFVMNGEVQETYSTALSAPELRAAAWVFTQLADALESGE